MCKNSKWLEKFESVLSVNSSWPKLSTLRRPMVTPLVALAAERVQCVRCGSTVIARPKLHGRPGLVAFTVLLLMASRPCLVLVVFERQDGGRLYESLNHRRITINLSLFPQNFTLQFEAAFSFSVGLESFFWHSWTSCIWCR